MRTLGYFVLMIVVTIGRSAPAQQPAQQAPLGPQDAAGAGSLDITAVQSALDRGMAYLRREQSPRGHWSDMPGTPGGVTALCTLAMLNCGTPTDDPHMRRALDYLRRVKPKRTYVVALQTMVFCHASPKQDGLLIRRNVKWLEQAQCKQGPDKGAWAYESPARHGDVSNSQFAVLALHEAERVGYAVSDPTWRLAHAYWTAMQLPSGAWGYNQSTRDTLGSRTCAGIAALVITSGEITGGAASVVDGRVQCCTDQEVNKSLDRSMQWLENHFSVLRNPGEGSGMNMWHYYYLYGVERVGRMTARRFIGPHDWYREGARFLVHEQEPISGFWRGAGVAERNPHIATSMALLFLSKGRRPVVAAKLRYGRTDDWNNHPHDLANLTIHAEQQWQRDLTWQVIDARMAQVEDLLQAPVLYLSGRKVPELTQLEKRKLRDYLDRGGFLFAEACCNGGPFEQGFRRLIDDLFPEPEYRLRLLPPEHPIWHAQQTIDPDHAKPLWGVDYGCRTSVVFCPEDLSCYWELARSGREEQYPKNVQDEIDAALATGVNVLTYATGREPKFKDVAAQHQLAEIRPKRHERMTIRLAKLQHPGRCDAAPGALVSLVRAAQSAFDVPIASDEQLLSITDPALARYHLVFMHGRRSFRLTTAERKALGAYLKHGGTLFVDSVCASRAFTESFRKEMQAILPEHPLKSIAASHSLFTTAHGGYDITTVSRRDPVGQASGEPLQATTRRVSPTLEAVTLDDRLAVIFSPYDLSCALERHDSLECQGYTRQDAARIGLNVLLYSLQ